MTKLSYLCAGLLFGSLLTFAFALGAPPQDPAKLSPDIYKVILDNDRLRVIDYHLKAGGKEPTHSHPAGAFVYYFTDAKTRTTLPDGRVSEDSKKAGDYVWRDPVTHTGENIGQ